MASKRNRTSNQRRYQKERRLTVRGVRRDPPDIRKLSKALLALAMAEAEREAQAEQVARAAAPADTRTDDPEEGGAPNA